MTSQTFQLTRTYIMTELSRRVTINPSWLQPGTLWGDDTGLISDVLGLYAYQTNLKYLRKQWGGNFLLFKCSFSDCGSTVKFLFSGVPKAWRVADFTDHSVECLAHLNDPEYLERLWSGKNETLVSIKFLAELCSSVINEKLSGRYQQFQPKLVASVLEENHWLPPFWRAKPGCEMWMHTLSSKVRKQMLTLPSNYSLPELSQIIQSNQGISNGSELAHISSFAEFFRSQDEDNQFHLDVDPISNRYLRCYLIFGIVKRLATHEHSTYQLDIDACHFTHPLRELKCPGNLRGVIYIDAAGCTYPLMLGHESREESIETWQYCIDILLPLFPHPEKIGIASDRDKGLDHVLKDAGDRYKFGQVICYAHLKRNVLAKMSKEAKIPARQMLEKLVYAKTLEDFNTASTEADQSTPELAAYLERSCSPAFYAKSQFPVQRLGITSNAVETYWASLLDWKIREMQHVVSIFKACHEELLSKLNKQNRNLGKWENVLTQEGIRQLEILSSDLSGMRAINILGSKGTVTDKIGRQYQCDIRTRTCPCTKEGVHPFFCQHLLVLSKALGIAGSVALLVPPAYHHENWKACMESSKPWNEINFNFSTESAQNSFDPPIYTNLRGAPPKKDAPKTRVRKTRSMTGKRGPRTDFFQDLTPNSLGLQEILETHGWLDIQEPSTSTSSSSFSDPSTSTSSSSFSDLIDD
jgi:hypothetical protein